MAKHANATAVSIDLTRNKNSVRLLIEDDGTGIAPQKPNPHRQTFGMAGMRERIANIGGKMKVTSSRGKGTRIEVNAPALTGEMDARPELLSTERGAVARGA